MTTATIPTHDMILATLKGLKSLSKNASIDVFTVIEAIAKKLEQANDSWSAQLGSVNHICVRL